MTPPTSPPLLHPPPRRALTGDETPDVVGHRSGTGPLEPHSHKPRDSIRWEGSTAWAKAEREIWKRGGETAGYVKRAENLTNAIVRNAGHLVPTDQPAWAKDLITRWVEGTPYGVER